MSITRLDYFGKCLQEDHLFNISWYYALFTLQDKDINNEWVRVVDNHVEVMISKDWEVLLDENKQPLITSPFLHVSMPIKLPKKTLANLEQDIDTTIGRAIVNKILLEHNFNNKLEYVNGKTSIGDLEKVIAAKLNDNSITVKEYIGFADSVAFLRGLTRITNVSATYKNILPPPNLDKIKNELDIEFTNKYGKDWVKNRTLVVEYQDRLKQVDAEWLKDDPSNGKLINGKIKSNARVKMFLTFGPEVGFDKSGENMTFVKGSLSDGYQQDKEVLTAMYNSSRSGSYDRGKETQKGGAAAKDLLRATSSYKIKGEDCGSKYGYDILVINDIVEALNGRYIVVGSNSILIDDAKKYLNKVVKLRSPMYCKNTDSSFCSTCVGTSMGSYKDGVSLSVLGVSNILLTTSLKSIHNSQVNLKDIDIKNIIT